MNLNIKKITVLLTSGTDRVTVYTDLPCPFIQESGLPQSLSMSFEVSQGHGIEYARKNFNQDPEIIDTISHLRK